MKFRIILLCGIASLAVTADELRPEPILPEALEWRGPPDNPALKGAWVIGSESAQAPYIFRVHLSKGGTIPPHTHPDTRHSIVKEGTLYVGFGEQVDRDEVVAVPAGAVYKAPANVPHYLLAIDGGVIYDEVGVGPTAVIPVEMAD